MYHCSSFTLALATLAAFAGAVCFASTEARQQGDPMGSIQKHVWGNMPNGQEVHLFTLRNSNGMTMKVTNYGCIIVSLTAPDRHGKFVDMVLGYDSLDEYVKNNPYFGSVVGRFGNRIAAGEFTLDGKTHKLATNNEPGGVPCHLHGGNVGYDKVLWDANGIVEEDAVGLRFHYLSKDGEEGYPGNLDITMHYWLTNDNALRIEYRAATDKPTPVNLTHHSYFNLGGHNAGTILNHELMIAADRITAVDKGLIPTGELLPVKGTPFDFTSPTPIGRRVNDDDEQLSHGPGYDHNFVLSRWDGKLRQAASVYDAESGRLLELLTTEPAMQFYCGNFLDGTNVGKGGHAYKYRTAFVLEAQHYPDSPNHPEFPSTILRPGEEYRQTTVYRFSTR